MQITLAERRFLIIWCSFHLFALCTSLIPIKGEIVDQNKYRDYIFTSTDHYNSERGFWPFVKMLEENGYSTNVEDYTYSSSGYPEKTVSRGKRSLFKGIFYNYSLGAFLVYILLGFGIIFIPKVWGVSEIESKETRTSESNETIQ